LPSPRPWPRFLRATARAVRDDVRSEIAACDVVPGDVLIVAEGDRICADVRIIDGTVTLDLSALIASPCQQPDPPTSTRKASRCWKPLISSYIAAPPAPAACGPGRVGLGWAAAISFSIGSIVANVPEGLLPTIAPALAIGVRELARRGAVVKRLSVMTGRSDSWRHFTLPGRYAQPGGNELIKAPLRACPEAADVKIELPCYNITRKP
jgi:hypothetical protein